MNINEIAVNTLTVPKVIIYYILVVLFPITEFQYSKEISDFFFFGFYLYYMYSILFLDKYKFDRKKNINIAIKISLYYSVLTYPLILFFNKILNIDTSNMLIVGINITTIMFTVFAINLFFVIPLLVSLEINRKLKNSINEIDKVPFYFLFLYILLFPLLFWKLIPLVRQKS